MDFQIPTIQEYISRNISVAIVIYYGYKHFAALYIPAANHQEQYVKFCDPLGYNLPSWIAEDLQAELGLATVKETVKLQNDYVNCGIFTVFALMNYISNKKISKENPLDLRILYDKQLKDNGITDNATFTAFFERNMKKFILTESDEVKKQRLLDEENGIVHTYEAKARPSYETKTKKLSRIKK